jgi:hypothetical protein
MLLVLIKFQRRTLGSEWQIKNATNILKAYKKEQRQWSDAKSYPDMTGSLNSLEIISRKFVSGRFY